MEHRTALDPDNLQRPEWNSLKANYSKHDVGEAYFVGRVEQLGLRAESWGIDKRDEDDHLIFDNKMDLKLWDGDQIAALCDVKAKTTTDWFGVLNFRHLTHYAMHSSDNPTIPTVMFFTIVDMDAEAVGEQTAVIDVPTDWNYRRLLSHYDGDAELSWDTVRSVPTESAAIDRVFRAPDGNAVVQMNESSYRDFDWFTNRL